MIFFETVLDAFSDVSEIAFQIQIDNLLRGYLLWIADARLS